MICNKCGMQMLDAAMFCPACGNPMAPAQPEYAAEQPMYEAPVQPMYEQPVYDQPVYEQPMYDSYEAPQPAPKKKTWLWILIGVLVAAAVTVGVLFATGVIGKKEEEGVANTPEAVAEAYLKFQFDDDMVEEFKLEAGDTREAFEDYITEQLDGNVSGLFSQCEQWGYDYDLDLTVESWDDFYDAYHQMAVASNKEDFGDDYTVKVEVTEVEEISEAELDTILGRHDHYLVVGDVEEGRRVTVSLSASGEDDTIESDRTLTLVKIDGKWKVLNDPTKRF